MVGDTEGVMVLTAAPPLPPEDAVKGGVPLKDTEGVSLPDPALQEDGVKVARGEEEGEKEWLVV